MALSKAQRDRLAQGWALHQQGKLLEAEKIYEGVRKQAPRDAEVLHLLGTVALRTGRAGLAVELIEAALRIDPKLVNAYNNLGTGLLALNRPSDAIARFDGALKLQADHAEALNNRAHARWLLGDFVAALADADAALAVRRNYADAWANRGLGLAGLQRRAEALAAFEQAIALQPTRANLQLARARLLISMDRRVEALASLRRAALLEPTSIEAQFGLAELLKDLDRNSEAVAVYEIVVGLDPMHDAALFALGNIQLLLGNLADAEATLRRLLILKPDSAQVLDALGVTLDRRGDNEQGLLVHQRAVALWPDNPGILCNIAIAMQNLGRYRDALDFVDRALTIDPLLADAHSNRARALWSLGRQADAIASVDVAIALKPSAPGANFNRAMFRLYFGDLVAGFAGYEWREKVPGVSTQHNSGGQRWSGSEAIAGRRIFVYWEQGLGDTVQFCRYLRKLVEGGAEVALCVQNSLARLLAQLGPGITIYPQDRGPGKCDFYSPLMSLPYAFGSSLSTIPANIPYLVADQADITAWRAILAQRFGAARRPRIGISWSGNTAHRNDARRSIPLNLWQDLLGFDADWIVVQKDLRASDVEALRAWPDIAHFPAEMTDFAATAGLLHELDLVITVDTSIAHLAGAMGKTVWILLGEETDWRWMADRPDSPWYPTAHLFRQTRPGEWAEVFRDVGHALAGLAGRPAP